LRKKSEILGLHEMYSYSAGIMSIQSYIHIVLLRLERIFMIMIISTFFYVLPLLF